MRKVMISCLSVFFSCLVFAVYFAHAGTGDNKQNPASDSGKNSYYGMTKEDLLKKFTTGSIKEYKRKGNKEAVVFDDVATSVYDDTITFYLVDGRVAAWDKRRIDFPESEEAMTEAVFLGMSKENLYGIYHPGNLKEYKRDGGKEIMIFDDIFSADPNDTITFDLVNGKITAFRKEKAEITPEARLKAIQERARFAVSNTSLPSSSDDLMLKKERDRASDVRTRRDNWYYRGGLYWR